MWPTHDQWKAAQDYFPRLPEDMGKEMYKTHSSQKQDSEKGPGAPEKSQANQTGGVRIKLRASQKLVPQKLQVHCELAEVQTNHNPSSYLHPVLD